MKPNQSGKRLCLAALALAALLAACHNNDDDDHGPSSTTPPPVADTPAPATTDAYVTYVSQAVAAQSDTTEPASTDGVTVTTPENTEPQPLPGS